MYRKWFQAVCFVIVIGQGTARFYNGRFNPGKVGEPEEVLIENEFISADWATMKVNHFDSKSKVTWQNRYLVNTEYYGGGTAPIFLMLRGENMLSAPFMVAGAWVEYARQFDALLFQLEHRYYGQSMPTYDLKMESLSLLTIDQTLADAASFIRQMNRKYDIQSNQKWIIFGGSYSGALATWLVQSYPNLAYGAVASSGTVKATMNFGRFFENNFNSFASQSLMCAIAIKTGFQALQTMMYDPIGQVKLKDILALPKTLVNTTNDDKINLIAAVSNNFAEVVQLNNVNTGGNNVTVELICKVMTDPLFGAPIERIGLANKLILKEHGETHLYFEYKPMIEQLACTSVESTVATGGFRQWLYQMCSQMGFFQTTDNRPHLFGNMIPLDFYVKQCSLVFGPMVNGTTMVSGILTNNLKQRGLRPNVKNVISLQGSFDPWHTVGITESIPDRVQAVFIEGTAHCADLYGSAPTDPPQLTNARQNVVQFLTELLADNQSESKESSEAGAMGGSSLFKELTQNSNFAL